MRIALEDLPSWAQELILTTALGLLEDNNAYATETIWSDRYVIHAHEYTYRCVLGIDRIY